MEKSGKFRSKKGFTVTLNEISDNEALSLQAKGLYTLIQRYITAPNFILYKSYLVKKSTNGKKSFETAWKELKYLGYLKQYRIPSGKNGTFTYEYELLDTPDPLTPALRTISLKRNMPTKNRAVEHHPHLGGDGKKAVDHTPHLASYGKSTVCLKHAMEDGGDIRNPDQHNPYFNKTNSLTLADSPQFPEGPEQREGLSKNDLAFEVKNELCSMKKLPSSYKSDLPRMEAAIHFMTEWSTFYPSGYKDAFQQRVYNLFNEALIDMCCADKPMTLKSSYVTYARVIDKINHLAIFENSYVDLSEFSEPAMDNFIRGSANEIRNPLQYMKACIWDALQTGSVSSYANLHQSGL